MKRLLSLTLCGIGSCLAGCKTPEAIERSFNTTIEKVVTPAVTKISDELTARSAQLQGQGSLINPGYHTRFVGFFGTGVIAEFDMNLTGVSANIAAATQADAGQAGTVKPPADRPATPVVAPPTEPVP